METQTNFKPGDTIRWSSPKNQNGLSAMYGVAHKVNKKSLSLTILAYGPHDMSQPTGRNETWVGGNHIAWDGPYTKEDIVNIAKPLIHNIGFGYKIKHITHWNPNQ